MLSSPDGKFRFILNYQNHFTKFCILRPLKSKSKAEVGSNLLNTFTVFCAPAILQCDNGHEFIAKVIEELVLIWKDLKIVHLQSQDSVERPNQDSPYAVLFGNEQKSDLSSILLSLWHKNR